MLLEAGPVFGRSPHCWLWPSFAASDRAEELRNLTLARHAVAETDDFRAGLLHLYAGRPADAVDWLVSKAPAQDLTPNTYLAPQTLTTLARAYLELGDSTAAELACQSALTVARELGMPRVVADATEQLARLTAPVDAVQAWDLHHEALSIRVAHGLWLTCVDSLEAIGGLALDAESETEATRLLGACDRARATMGYPRPVSDEGLRTRMRDALGGQAYQVALDEGRATELTAALAYARRSRGVRGRPSSGWASLTPTEREVSRLAVEGLANADIGKRLFMSRSTVKTHLGHVYPKLGVSNRTELAARAAAQAPAVTGLLRRDR